MFAIYTPCSVCNIHTLQCLQYILYSHSCWSVQDLHGHAQLYSHSCWSVQDLHGHAQLYSHSCWSVQDLHGHAQLCPSHLVLFSPVFLRPVLPYNVISCLYLYLGPIPPSADRPTCLPYHPLYMLATRALFPVSPSVPPPLCLQH